MKYAYVVLILFYIYYFLSFLYFPKQLYMKITTFLKYYQESNTRLILFKLLLLRKNNQDCSLSISSQFINNYVKSESKT